VKAAVEIIRVERECLVQLQYEKKSLIIHYTDKNSKTRSKAEKNIYCYSKIISILSKNMRCWMPFRVFESIIIIIL
jgi:hypothetical protein